MFLDSFIASCTVRYFSLQLNSSFAHQNKCQQKEKISAEGESGVWKHWERRVSACLCKLKESNSVSLKEIFLQASKAARERTRVQTAKGQCKSVLVSKLWHLLMSAVLLLMSAGFVFYLYSLFSRLSRLMRLHQVLRRRWEIRRCERASSLLDEEDMSLKSARFLSLLLVDQPLAG